MVENKSKARGSKALLHIFFIFMSACFVVPLVAVISISISNEPMITRMGYSLLPRRVDFTAYKYILDNPMTIIGSYKVTAIVSFGGTVLYLIVASMCAYAISRPAFRFKKQISFYLFFTMLFNGGLVPTYVLMTRYLRLKDTYLALILPLLVNVWYLFILRTFFSQLPNEIFESATVDGAGEMRIFMQIALPLCKPALATVGLLMLLNFWNSWYNAMLYINDASLYPLQYLLQVMLRNIQEILKDMQNNVPAAGGMFNVPTENTRMAMCILAAGPMLLIFPFFQKYFTKGLTVGSVKG